MKNRRKSRLMKCAICFGSLLIPAAAVCAPGIKGSGQAKSKTSEPGGAAAR